MSGELLMSSVMSTKVWLSTRTAGVMDTSRPIQVGERVAIFRISQINGPFIEGRAVVKARVRGPHRYRVRFEVDGASRERVVRREFQHNPEAWLEILRDIWRASNEPAFDDFFPEDN